MAEPVVNEALIKYFGIQDYSALLDQLGDDLRYVQPGYCGPPPRTFPDGSRELVWPVRGWPVPTRYIDVRYGDGYYTEAFYRPFADIRDPAELDRFDFPTPEWLDYSTVRTDCQRLSAYAIVTGTPGVLDFINGISHSRGIEQVLIDIGLEDPVYLALLEKKFADHYGAVERTLQAGQGMIDIVQTGEDLGTQQGLLLSPHKFNKLFADKYRAFFDMVHRYGARVMLHVCGSARGLLPRLVDLGLDILDVVQTSAAGMDIGELRAQFGRDLNYCGSICVQTTLPRSTPEQIIREVALRQQLFADGGLILAPSHLIQADTPLENILTLYEAAGSLARL
jgi:uroporphyrinogen decarboxylase